MLRVLDQTCLRRAFGRNETSSSHILKGRHTYNAHDVALLFQPVADRPRRRQLEEERRHLPCTRRRLRHRRRRCRVAAAASPPAAAPSGGPEGGWQPASKKAVVAAAHAAQLRPPSARCCRQHRPMPLLSTKQLISTPPWYLVHASNGHRASRYFLSLFRGVASSRRQEHG